ncbi:PDZ domain-containing protein [Meloidogyne graminicola]|uniref:PDZ domain-containing protein n=1 Tax=Meloidogyne graminicola TaxID=189291 RepID=A0A8S9ZKW5_9BILA|nr:PDZ domain-containing protein [Meloidogyne graminicola]
MSTRSGSSGSISEVNVEAKRRSKDPRIEFVEGTRPPRVQKVGYNSYLNGRLYVGDEVIRLNDTDIHSAEDFFRIVTVRSLEPEMLRIRVRRDHFYRITIRKVEGEGKGKGEVFDLEIKWRRGGMPLGVSMEDSREIVTICGTEAGSIADGNFHYGDIMTHVNGKEVKDVKTARAAILEAINEHNSLTIRVLRPVQLEDVSHLPSDVSKVIRRNVNFHRHGHKYSAAINAPEREATTSSLLSRLTGRGGNSSKRSNRSSPEVARVTIQRPSAGDIREIPADPTETELKRTPPRHGSQERQP